MRRVQATRYTAGAVGEGTKLGLGHLRSWERVAIVGDADRLRRAVHGVGWLMPGEIEAFGPQDLGSAREWGSSMLPDLERFHF